MSEANLEELQKIANDVRIEIVKMLSISGSGHTAGSLGMADIFVALYFNILNHDPKDPSWKERDRLILSNGHICPVQYATLAHAGYFSLAELKTLRKIDSRLQGHPERVRLPGIETTSGPLGCGLAQAAGIAYAARMDKARFRVFCICSDAEHDEGNHWEGVMFAAKYCLGNLTVFVDRNLIQLSGKTEDIMPIEPLADKYRAFNWNVLEINGHNFNEIISSVAKARAVYDKPTVIIAYTVPGKGVSFMENDYRWHGLAPNKEEAEKALRELKKKDKNDKSKT